MEPAWGFPPFLDTFHSWTPPPSWGHRDGGRRRQPVPGASLAPGGSERWMRSKIQHTRDTEKHGFGINLAPELALLVLFLLRSLTSTQIQEKRNVASVGHGETLGKRTRKGINPPKTGPMGTRSGRNWQHCPSSPCQIWSSPGPRAKAACG